MALAIQDTLGIIHADKLGLLLLALIITSTAPAHAEDGPGELIFISGYEVNLTPAELEHADRNGMDGQISFLDLPLWIKVAHISGSIVMILGSLIILPAALRKDKESQANKNRVSIMDFIAKNPGCIISHIIKKENIPKGTARYHLKILEAEGKIILKRIGKSVRLFVSSHAISDKEKLVASYVNNEIDRKLIYTILKSEGITNKELSNNFNMNKSVTYWHLKKFLDGNIVEFRQEGRYKKYYICSDIRGIIANILMESETYIGK